MAASDCDCLAQVQPARLVRSATTAPEHVCSPPEPIVLQRVLSAPLPTHQRRPLGLARLQRAMDEGNHALSDQLLLGITSARAAPVDKCPRMRGRSSLDESTLRPLVERALSAESFHTAISADRKEPSQDVQFGKDFPGEVLDLANEEDQWRPIKTQCEICWEELRAPSDLQAFCGRPQCTWRFCSKCRAKSAKVMVLGAMYAVPWLPCPGCRARVPTAAWSALVESELVSTYLKNAAALLSFRCPDCHQTGTLFCSASCSSTEEREAAEIGAFQGLPTAATAGLCRAWLGFARGEASADEFIEEFLASSRMLEGDTERSDEEEAVGVPPASVEARICSEQLLSLVEDPERRFCLQLGWRRRFPMMRTPCCNCKLCFKCKIAGWHEDETCEERQRKEVSQEVQFCPGCGVPIVKSEGCDHIMCVCGREWTWQTPERSAVAAARVDVLQDMLNDGLDIDFADHETGETMLHQAVAAASEEVVRFLIDAGARSLADNEGQTPLLALISRDPANDEDLAILSALDDGGLVRNHSLHSVIENMGRGPGQTAQTHAVRHEVLRRLVEATASLDQYDENGDTALVLASKAGISEVVEKLLELGASAVSESAHGVVPLTAAVEGQGSIRLVQMLLDFRADAAHADSRGRTALHALAGGQWQDSGRAEAALLLISAKGAVDVEMSIEHGDARTPLDVLLQKSWLSNQAAFELYQALLNNGARRGSAPVVDNLASPVAHEVEFRPTVLDERKNMKFSPGEHIRSASCEVRGFRFRILLFPAGITSQGGRQVSVFVEGDPTEDYHPNWCIPRVRYSIALVNWLDYRLSKVNHDIHTWSQHGSMDQGWPSMLSTANLSTSSGWVSENGELLVRASVFVSEPLGVAERPLHLAEAQPLRKQALHEPTDHQVVFRLQNLHTYSAGAPIRSETKTLRDVSFCLLVFPKGLASGNGRHLAAYVEVHPPELADNDWDGLKASYCIAVLNWKDDSKSTVHKDTFMFTPRTQDRGWPDLLPTETITTESGWLNEKGELLLLAEVSPHMFQGIGSGPAMPSEYDSRAEVGQVSLVDSTDLPGSAALAILHSFYHIPVFRDAVASLSDKLADVATKPRHRRRRQGECTTGDFSGPADLREIFDQLGTSRHAVTAERLGELLGDESPADERRKLLDLVQTWFAHSPNEDLVSRLFEGERGSPPTSFDLLRLHGGSVEEALRQVAAEESDAIRRLPPVLTLLVERPVEKHEPTSESGECEGDDPPPHCDYCMERLSHSSYRESCFKCGRRAEGVQCMRCSAFLCNKCAKDFVDRGTPGPDHSAVFSYGSRLELASLGLGDGVYDLHSVIIGESCWGDRRFHAIVRPDPAGPWLRYWRSTVARCRECYAMEDSFGGHELLSGAQYLSQLPSEQSEPARVRRRHSAEMLVYVRREGL